MSWLLWILGRRLLIACGLGKAALLPRITGLTGLGVGAAGTAERCLSGEHLREPR